MIPATVTLPLLLQNLPALMVRLLMRVYAMGVAGDAPHEQIKPELLLMYFTICDRMLMNEVRNTNLAG